MDRTGFVVEPLTPARWGDLEDLFGPQGPCYGCWCNHFRMPQRLRKPLLGEGARQLFEDRVKTGPPPGVLAYAGDKPVGWLQVGPRADIPEWNNPRRASTPLPDAPAEDIGNWAASCFFVRKGFRGKGVTGALIEGAVAFARGRGQDSSRPRPWTTGTSAARRGSMSGRKACSCAQASSRSPGRSRGGRCSG